MAQTSGLGCASEPCPALCLVQTWQIFMSPSIWVRSISQLENTTSRISLNINWSDLQDAIFHLLLWRPCPVTPLVNRTLKCLMIVKPLNFCRVYLPHSRVCVCYLGLQLSNFSFLIQPDVVDHYDALCWRSNLVHTRQRIGELTYP